MTQIDVDGFTGGSGADLIAFLQQLGNALASFQKGATAPPDPKEGMVWLDDSGSSWLAKRRVNGAWHTELKLDNATGKVSIPDLGLPDPIASTYLRRNAANDGYEVRTATQMVSDLGVGKMIASNLTLYIAPGGNDTTGDGSSGNPWFSPHKALTYLQGFRIMPGVDVTIQCGVGYYNLSTLGTVVWNHPDSRQINLVGAAGLKNLVSVQTTGGTPGNYDYTYNMSSVSDLVMYSTFMIYPPWTSGGSSPIAACGVQRLVAYDGSNRPIARNSNRSSTNPSGVVAGTNNITHIRVAFDFGNNNGFNVYHGSCLRGEQFSIITGSSYFGVKVGGYGVYEFNANYDVLPLSSCMLNSVHTWGSYVGFFVVNGGFARLSYCGSSGGNYGLLCYRGGQSNCFNCLFNGCASAGVQCSLGGMLYQVGSALIGNYYGCRAETAGRTSTTGSSNADSYRNYSYYNTIAFEASYGGVNNIVSDGALYLTGNGTDYTPAVNTAAANGALNSRNF